MYKALIFDLDGLLIDSESIYRKISYKMADDLGKKLHDGIWVKQMGRSPIESLGIFCRELGITSQTPQELVDLRNEMLVEEYGRSLEIMPGALEILQAFDGKMRMAIATGSPSILMNIALSRLGIGDYFEYMLPSDDIKAGKPDPEIYLNVVEKLGLAPQECVVLEDSSNGALSGHRAGCFVIAVPSIYTKNQDFTFADWVAKDLFDAARSLADYAPFGR
ncbi:MAG: HAD family phosphatase [Bacteroidales bacterium]|jgi:HAD superfamily hydrolase (TIGR01509 family)